MTVSFTGIKNVGYLMNGSAEQGIYKRAINLQVTNDEDGNDLDKFEEVLKETGTEYRYHMDTPGLISFLMAKQRKDNHMCTYDFVLNNNELEINDENLPIFSYLGKILTRISEMEERDMVVDDSVYMDNEIYKHTTLGSMAYELGKESIKNKDETTEKIIEEMENINETGQEKTEKDKNIDMQGYYVYQAYYPENAKFGAAKINKQINHIMRCYVL